MAKEVLPIHHAIKKMFPESDDLSSIWKEVFDPVLSAITGKPQLNVVKLDELLIAEYGEYKGSLEDFIVSEFGEDVMNTIKPE